MVSSGVSPAGLPVLQPSARHAPGRIKRDSNTEPIYDKGNERVQALRARWKAGRYKNLHTDLARWALKQRGW